MKEYSVTREVEMILKLEDYELNFDELGCYLIGFIN